MNWKDEEQNLCILAIAVVIQPSGCYRIHLSGLIILVICLQHKPKFVHCCEGVLYHTHKRVVNKGIDFLVDYLFVTPV